MKKNILSVILALVMILAVCPAYAEATETVATAETAGEYIINEDFSETEDKPSWLEYVDGDDTDSAKVSIENGAIKIVRDDDKSSNQPYAKVYFKADETAITKPTAISFTLSKNAADNVAWGYSGTNIWTWWQTDNKVYSRYATEVGTDYSSKSCGTFASSSLELTYVINPAENKYSLWVNGTKKIDNQYTKDGTSKVNYFQFKWNYGNYAATMPATNYFTVDDIKVWDFVKEEATYSGTGYNNGNLQAGDIALSLPISYIPNGTDNKVTVIMAAYDKDTNELIAISDIEENTFTGADFYTFTPEMTIPDSAGGYYVKTMIWKSGTLVPLCAAEELR